jgi:hypothetical protein
MLLRFLRRHRSLAECSLPSFHLRAGMYIQGLYGPLRTIASAFGSHTGDMEALIASGSGKAHVCGHGHAAPPCPAKPHRKERRRGKRHHEPSTRISRSAIMRRRTISSHGVLKSCPEIRPSQSLPPANPFGTDAAMPLGAGFMLKTYGFPLFIGDF